MYKIIAVLTGFSCMPNILWSRIKLGKLSGIQDTHITLSNRFYYFILPFLCSRFVRFFALFVPVVLKLLLSAFAMENQDNAVRCILKGWRWHKKDFECVSQSCFQFDIKTSRAHKVQDNAHKSASVHWKSYLSKTTNTALLFHWWNYVFPLWT